MERQSGTTAGSPFSDPERSIIAWAWARHDKYTARYAKAMRDEQWQHINFVRVRSAQEARSFLQTLKADQLETHS